MKTLENVIQKWGVSMINNSSAATFHKKINFGTQAFHFMVRYEKYLDMRIILFA